MSNKKRMTIKRAVLKLRELQMSDDPEAAHGEADDVLCNLLTSLGAKEVAQEFMRVPKWYA